MITEIVGFTAVAAVAAVATRCGYKIPVIPSYSLLVGYVQVDARTGRAALYT